MKKNESGTDRIIRLVVGVILILLAFKTEPDKWTMVFYVAGVIAIITAATGFCALYKIFGVDTSKK